MPQLSRTTAALVAGLVAGAAGAVVLAWWSGSAAVGVLVPAGVLAACLRGTRLRVAAWFLGPLAVAAVTAAARDWSTGLWLLAATAAAAAVAHLVGRRLDVTERARVLAEDRSEALTVRDELTGCVNQRGLQLLGEQMLHDVRRRGDAVHGTVVRVQRLDAVERQLGREAADEVLLTVAEALRAGTRGTDVVASGPRGEFRILGPGSGVSAGEVERRLRSHVLDRMPVPTSVWPCLVGIGSASLEPWDSGEITDVLRRAEDDLSLRVAMRAPSVPEPPLRRPI